MAVQRRAIKEAKNHASGVPQKHEYTVTGPQAPRSALACSRVLGRRVLFILRHPCRDGVRPFDSGLRRKISLGSRFKGQVLRVQGSGSRVQNLGCTVNGVQ